jgi:hypothetical protein
MEFNRTAFITFLMIATLLVMIMSLVLTAGCITAAKSLGKEIMKTPTPTPTPVPTPRPTTLPTPTPIPTVPTLAPHYVDPYLHGERWEGQWFKWLRKDVQGINGEGTKDLHVGIIAYRHAFMDKYTWYNNAMGQYYEEKAPEGYRYFIVWVHEEMIGDNTTFDPSMWAFDEDAFRLQNKDQLIRVETTHNETSRIREFDNYYDYYNTVTAGPFGYNTIFTGANPETAGYVADRVSYLRMGKSNSIDGYLMFEIPKDTKPEDLLLLASFSTFGTAYWRFTR